MNNTKFLNFSRLTETYSTSGSTSYNVGIATPLGKATEFMITGLWEESSFTVIAKNDVTNGIISINSQ
jgi:saccharopine dehydrogenase-like NADP-dependent oxidoreductase